MTGRLAPIFLAVLAACGGPADDAQPPDEQDLASHPPRHLFTLAHAPFPGNHPTALVHLGKGFQRGGPLNLVVHFHGWQNCVANDAESSSSRCTRGQAARFPHRLIEQVDASGVNAALVAIELAYDQQSSADGRLAEDGFFRALIAELLPQISALAGRSYSLDDLGGIILSSHSGGYRAAGDVLAHGGLTDHVRQVLLFDSLYGSVAQFEGWVTGDLGNRRLSVLYTDHGGTAANSQALADRLGTALDQAGLHRAALLADDRRTNQPLEAGQLDLPLSFIRSPLSHDGTVASCLAAALAHSGL